MTIIVDESKYHARTNRVPPKSGPVQASFWIGGTLITTQGFSYEHAVNNVKRLYARPVGARIIVLEDVQAVQ